MKTIVPLLTLLISLLVVTQASAQTTTQFPSPAPGLPGFNNSFGPFFTNQFENGFGNSSLNQLLVQLQFDLTQLYPVVVGINNSFDFTTAGTNALGTNGISGSAGIASPTAPGTIATRSGNSSTLLSSSAGANLGTSLGQDLSGIIGGRANALGASGTAINGGVAPAISPITPTTGAGTSGAAVVTTGLAFSSPREVLRALLLLQDDIERMLPLVNALNGGSVAGLNTLFTNNLGVLTNGIFVNGAGTVTGSGAATRGTGLTPTGR